MPARYKYNAPVHLNGNIFCAVDVETTGFDPLIHSIIEICILPLNGDYSINKSITPFTTTMQPIQGKIIDAEAMAVNKIDLANVMLHSLDAYKVLDLLVEWYEKLGLAVSKRIVPIAQNWPFDRSFLIAWMGIASYELMFDRHYRDTMALALSLNDRADMMNHKIPYPKVSLKYLATQFHIENPDPHRALGDCATTAMVYKSLLLSPL